MQRSRFCMICFQTLPKSPKKSLKRHPESCVRKRTTMDSADFDPVAQRVVMLTK